MALTMAFMLVGGFVGGCVGAFAVLCWADGLIDKTTAEFDVDDWDDEALDVAPIDAKEWEAPNENF